MKIVKIRDVYSCRFYLVKKGGSDLPEKIGILKMKLPDPDYHSIIAHKDTGLAITVFDWAVKKFSEYGVDDGFVAKFYAAVDAVIGHGENNDNKYENRYLFTPNVK